MTTDINVLWQNVYDIQSQPIVDDSSRQRLREICSQLRDPTSPVARVDRSLLLGYVAYHFGDVVSLPVNCEDELQYVLQHAPENQTAKLYLGHFYFDRADFSRAKECLASVDQTQYLAIGQEWRSLKIRELLIVCDLHLGLFKDALSGANTLLADMRRVNSNDCPIPIELLSAIASSRNELEVAMGSGEVETLLRNVTSMFEYHQWSTEPLERFRR